MICEDRLEPINALLDGELGPPDAALLAAHLADCPSCRKLLAELGQLRNDLSQLIPERDAPSRLQAKIEAALDAQAAVRSPVANKLMHVASRMPITGRRGQRLGWAAAALVIAAMTAALLAPRHNETVDFSGVRDAVLRSSVSESSVAAEPAPVIAGFQLVAARRDLVAGHVAQVLQYLRSGQTITLCIWAANGEPAHVVKNATYRGMVIRYWNDGDREYWAASARPGLGLDMLVARLTKG